MSNADLRPPASGKTNRSTAERIHRGIVALLLAIMAVELGLILRAELWLSGFLVLVVMSITAAPFVLKVRLPVRIPSEFQVLAIVFMFASVFLGEVRSFYERLWWWDIALHAASGLLLGMVGFLLVYVLNENERIDLHMRPRFVAFFAFLFAVAFGVFWEIFEFVMDQIFRLNMQKPMAGDPSGLTDTMWDLIVDTLGALAISILGWWYMKRREQSFIDVWIRKFIDKNPRLFPDP